MSGGAGERTEKATPKRRKKARREGRIGNTPEVGAWLGLLVATFVLPALARSLQSVAATSLVRGAALIKHPDIRTATAIAKDAAGSALRAVVPLAVVMAIVGIAAVAGQGGLAIAPAALKPKFSRLNPLSGLKRMFGAHGWWQLAKSLGKSAALGTVVWLSVRSLIPQLAGAGALPLSVLVHTGVATALRLLRFAAVAGLLLALVDAAVVRRRNNKQLKMTKQEVKDEFRNSEGDPQVRMARRSRQMAMRRNRMIADVAQADVVLVNPTHVAVALRYDAGRGAPRVIAKGADHAAARIRAVADRHRVPMVADVTLARTLYAACEVGQEIPPDLYRAVAIVLAFIMTLKKRGSAAGVHTVRALTGQQAA
jgi:flagellar biosynthetic protein FlhB